MVEGLISLLAGGGTGLLGTIFSKAFGFFEAKQRHSHELELLGMDLKMMEVEALNAERQHALELEQKSFEASYADAGKRFSYKGSGGALVFVDVVRGLTRPVLTLLFLGLTGWVYFTIEDASIRDRVVDTILYLSTVTVTWWFGTRPQKPVQTGRAGV